MACPESQRAKNEEAQARSDPNVLVLSTTEYAHTHIINTYIQLRKTTFLFMGHQKHEVIVKKSS